MHSWLLRDVSFADVLWNIFVFSALLSLWATLIVLTVKAWLWVYRVLKP